MGLSPGDINQRIWHVVTMIPRGTVATYGDVAQQAGMPGAARRVGRALRELPRGSKIPWHRVINAQGKIAVPTGNPARQTQRRRLLAEGVDLCGESRISLKQYRWRPGEPSQGSAASTLNSTN